jgi:uncharacterized protein (DUF2345 family)
MVLASTGMAIYSAKAQATATKKLEGQQASLLAKSEPEKIEATATETAKKEMAKRRRVILASGGQTDITAGTATLGSSGSRLKSLLG